MAIGNHYEQPLGCVVGCRVLGKQARIGQELRLDGEIIYERTLQKYQLFDRMGWKRTFLKSPRYRNNLSSLFLNHVAPP